MISSFAYYVMALRREFISFCNEKLQKIGLSQGQLLFLIYIGKNDNCSPKELASSLHMDNAHAARSIVKLVEAGFLLQTVNPKDRRSHVLTLTEKGKSAFQISHELFSEWDAKIMSNVSKEQQEKILELMAMLVHQNEGEHSVR